MAARLRHRGPDWSGIYVDDRAILAHERLSIVDVEHGAQPLIEILWRQKEQFPDGVGYGWIDHLKKHAAKMNDPSGRAVKSVHQQAVERV